MIERRRFSRIVYQATALVFQDNKSIEASIRDLSLHGLLLHCPHHNIIDRNCPISVRFQLPDSEISIELDGRIISAINGFIRIMIEHIDIESIGHLKRIVELNVGDDELLHREIEQLSDLGQFS